MYDRFVDFCLDETLLSVGAAVTEVVDLCENNFKKLKVFYPSKLDLTILLVWLNSLNECALLLQNITIYVKFIESLPGSQSYQHLTRAQALPDHLWDLNSRRNLIDRATFQAPPWPDWPGFDLGWPPRQKKPRKIGQLFDNKTNL